MVVGVVMVNLCQMRYGLLLQIIGIKGMIGQPEQTPVVGTALVRVQTRLQQTLILDVRCMKVMFAQWGHLMNRYYVHLAII